MRWKYSTLKPYFSKMPKGKLELSSNTYIDYKALSNENTIWENRIDHWP